MAVRVITVPARAGVRALCVVNPAAGGRHAAPGDLDRAIRMLREGGFDLRVVETGAEHPTAAELAAGAVRDGMGSVIVAGGDGTVHPAATQLLDTGVVLGILPFGSFMNVAKGLGLPMSATEAAEVIVRGHIASADVGQVDGRIFFETAGVGLDAEMFLAARLAERGRWRNALRRVRRWATQGSHRMRITVDGQAHAHRAYQVLVLNSPFYTWSFPVVPEASMRDGQLEVAVFSRMGRRALVRSLLELWRSGRHGRPPIVYRGREIRIEADRPLSVHADGQAAGRLPVSITCRAGALRVYAPEQAG